MTTCEDALTSKEYRVTVLVANTYRVTGRDEKEAENKALEIWGQGVKAPAVWPVKFETTPVGAIEAKEEV